MDEQSQYKPFYRRPGFYIISIVSVAVFCFLFLLITILALNWVNPSFTSFTLREDWSKYETGRYSLREYWVPSGELPSHLKWAVIASEDQLYYDHHGFDLKSIREAWAEMQTGKRVRGASTISQQTAKNLFLSPSQSFIRKGAEAVITILLELLLSKERILEIYLNIAEFGPGIFGVGKASDEFFGLHASSLEPEMSARLAAVLPSPKRMRVNPPSPFAEERSHWILRQMSRLSGVAWVPEPQPVPVPIDSIVEFPADRDPLLEIAESELERELFGSGADTAETGNDSLQAEPGLVDTLSRFQNQPLDSVIIDTTADSIRINRPNQ